MNIESKLIPYSKYMVMLQLDQQCLILTKIVVRGEVIYDRYKYNPKYLTISHHMTIDCHDIKPGLDQSVIWNCVVNLENLDLVNFECLIVPLFARIVNWYTCKLSFLQ